MQDYARLVPLDGMPDSTVDTGALYAGDTALRISEVVSAQQAVNDLAP
jgi:nitronate monooxygenase